VYLRCYGLDGPGIETRWEARCSASVQTGPGAHPASYTMGTGSFQGVKRPGRGVYHPSPSSAEVKERVEIYLYSLSGPSWPVLGRTLPLPLVPKMLMILYEQSTIISSLKNTAARPSETQVILNQNTRRHIPEDSILISNFILRFVFRLGRH
jgi:hypothetical protein